MTAPGVTFETVDLNRPRVAQLRTDICGFVGYAERGPIDRPVKVQSWRQFLDAFGPPLEFANTGHAIRLYFENGGDAAYVARVSDPAVANSASADVGRAVTMRATYAAIDRPGSDAPGPTANPAASASLSPGAWGNRLSVLVQAGGLGATQSLQNQPGDGASIRVETIAGFEVGSYVRLVQDGQVAPSLGLVAAIDPALGEITWSTPIVGLGLNFVETVQLETVEFTLAFSFDGQEIYRHNDLSLNPVHSRFVERVLADKSPIVSADATVDPADLADETSWPQPGPAVRFGGGRDGLATVTRQHFISALEMFERVDEISVLAAPDLVLVADTESEPPAPLLPNDVCKTPEALPAGVLYGVIFEAGTEEPVAGVRVSSRDVLTRAALTDAAGEFTLTGLPVGQVELQVEKAGFLTSTATAQSFTSLLGAPQRFEIAQRVLPPAFSDDEVFEVQNAMIGQGERGFYRVAILDPPQTMLKVEDLRGWRARFDTSFAALYWPWMVTSPPDQEARLVPPSGAVAGLVARMDRVEGPQRAPANRPLREIQALSHTVDDATHGLLNELGINVLRATPGRGIAPQGARTLSSDFELRYLGVRRLLLMIAEAIEESHQWAVFEPNTRILRDAIVHSLTAFLRALWSTGALAGRSPESAFAVKCDEENNPPEVIDAGQLVAQIAVAPVRPYEFIRLRLGRTDRLQVQVQE